MVLLLSISYHSSQIVFLMWQGHAGPLRKGVGNRLPSELLQMHGTCSSLSCVMILSILPTQDCGDVVASKFFPIEGPDGRQKPLCERDYFRRLNLICAKCGLALRGSYITACSKSIFSSYARRPPSFFLQTRSFTWNTLHALSVLPFSDRRTLIMSTTEMCIVTFTTRLDSPPSARDAIVPFSSSLWRSIGTCGTNVGTLNVT